MTEKEQLTFILSVLDAVSFDDCDMIWWRTDAPEYDPVTFLVNCNDLFWWGTADCEDVTPENVHLLKMSIEDVREIDGCSDLGTELFCCRAREMRPQGAAYPKNEKLWPLFDECGPDRDADKNPFGNPLKHPRRSDGHTDDCK